MQLCNNYDACRRLPRRPPKGGYRIVQQASAARIARHCFRTMTNNDMVNAVPATVHGEGDRLQYYPPSAHPGVRHFSIRDGGYKRPDIGRAVRAGGK